MQIIFYTDGASRGNPGKGGWGVYVEIILENKEKKVFQFSGNKINATNNQMELVATIQALDFLNKVVLKKYLINPENKKRNLNIKIKTDSKYVKTGITEWIKKWEKNNWKNSNKKDVLNKELWERLLKLKNEINLNVLKDLKTEIEFEYVAGHKGITGNEIADHLATSAAEKL